MGHGIRGQHSAIPVLHRHHLQPVVVRWTVRGRWPVKSGGPVVAVVPCVGVPRPDEARRMSGVHEGTASGTVAVPGVWLRAQVAVRGSRLWGLVPAAADRGAACVARWDGRGRGIGVARVAVVAGVDRGAVAVTATVGPWGAADVAVRGRAVSSTGSARATLTDRARVVPDGSAHKGPTIGSPIGGNGRGGVGGKGWGQWGDWGNGWVHGRERPCDGGT
jgi:hypothetical protein